jgi:cystathionine beta-lyase/cystathionine gamma-synthase
MLESIKTLLDKLPSEWLTLTTHRLDIYNESHAKTEFLDELKTLVKAGDVNAESLKQLPTAYDYIRLGHQLSSLLEWVLAEINQVDEEQVITFASNTMPILALLRSNTLNNKATHIYYDGESSPLLDEDRLKDVYGYQYQLTQVAVAKDIPQHHDTTVVFVTQQPFDTDFSKPANIDATVNLHEVLGSYMVIHASDSAATVRAVQHVRRRETIAMSPLNCFYALRELVGLGTETTALNDGAAVVVADCIRDNTGSDSAPLIASSGLSIQYAILMGLVEEAQTAHPNKPIKIVLPPNCYGGTNDQSRRVADLIPNVEIVDLLVDGGADLVNSLETVLNEVARLDGVPIVLAEIPTNPRVEVPDMQALGLTLSKTRQITHAKVAVKPTFMVDQTFCPNVKLLHDDSELKAVRTISFSSGSKFPSGGRCIAGYCAANQAGKDLMPLISAHLRLSDNAADFNQLNTLAETMPSMPERIDLAYQKTREFVQQIQALLPNAKMFYVNDDMAQRGFKPSVFSLDLPVDAETPKQRQELQKELNKKLIEFMIERHPDDCKNCVSYGQLKGSYWTIPATSTQGTTKEDDKDYVVRASISPDVDVALLTESFKEFCEQHDLN